MKLQYVTDDTLDKIKQTIDAYCDNDGIKNAEQRKKLLTACRTGRLNRLNGDDIFLLMDCLQCDDLGLVESDETAKAIKKMITQDWFNLVEAQDEQ